MIEFFVAVEPRPAGRPKFTAVKGKKRTFATAYTPKETKIHRTLLAYHASQAAPDGPMEGPLILIMTVIKIKPKSYSRKRWSWEARPDLDNFIKLIDAFQGILWKDDAQVIEIHARKCFGPRPGYFFRIERAVEEGTFPWDGQELNGPPTSGTP
jgi:Holliday junction resolvase RusA-like endonuclease